MDSQTIVNEINRKLNGEYEVVEFESDDWNTIVSAANENIDLYNKSAKWRTAYNPMYSIGTVGDSEFYTLNWNEINEISSSNRTSVIFYDVNDNIVDRYKIVSQDLFDLAEQNDKVVTINMNGLQLKPKTSTDKIYGTTIVLPVYLNSSKIVRASDKPKLDDIYWLIIKTAADLSSTSPVSFIARNFEPFTLDAEKRMKAMKKANRDTQSSYPAIGNWSPSGRPDGR